MEQHHAPANWQLNMPCLAWLCFQRNGGAPDSPWKSPSKASGTAEAGSLGAMRILATISMRRCHSASSPPCAILIASTCRHLRCLQNCCWWCLEEIKVLPLDQKESPLSPNLSTNMEKPGIKKMAAKQEQMGALPVLRHHGHSVWPTGCSDFSSPPPARMWKKNWTPEKTIMTAWVEWLPHPAEGISSWGEALSTTDCWHFPRTRIA